MPTPAPDPLLTASQQSTDLISIAVTLGRMEAMLTSSKENQQRSDDRLERVESGLTEVKADISVLKSQQRPKTPWWAIAGGVAAVLAAVAGFWQLFSLAAQIAQSLP